VVSSATHYDQRGRRTGAGAAVFRGGRVWFVHFSELGGLALAVYAIVEALR
jgi:hypothetical protein